MTEIRDQLAEHLRQLPVPVLFVGAGMSRRYAGATGWVGLLQQMALVTGRPYEYFASSANGQMPAVASKIAAELHEKWWTDPSFESSRSEWAGRVGTHESPFKIEVSRVFRELTLAFDGEVESQEIELLKDAVVDGIVTTNYDLLLEELFPSFRPFIGQDGLIFSPIQNVGEIYKIHGCCTAPESLVITKADYDRFESRSKYLAAKLLTIFVEHPVIFLGYSITDPNVQAILRAVAACLDQEHVDSLRNRLIFVEWDEEGAPPTMRSDSLIIDGIPLPITRLDVPNFLEVFSALASLDRQFPASLLRRLKEQVYQAVLSDRPERTFRVIDIDDESEGVEFVVGVGVGERFSELGYTSFDRWRLADDVLNAPHPPLDAELILTKTLPKLLSGNANMPIFKYLRAAGRLESGSPVLREAVAPQIERQLRKVVGGLSTGSWYDKRQASVLSGISTVAQLESRLGYRGVLDYGLYVPVYASLTDDLREFLVRHRDKRAGTWEGTQYMKLVCHLDYLENGSSSHDALGT